jgi:ATP-dependent protease ClpP protease subunit
MLNIVAAKKFQISSGLPVRKVSIIAMLFLAATLTAKADIKLNDDIGNAYITNTITERDAKEFQEFLKRLNYVFDSVSLNSTGGSVSAAMQIGRLVRKYNGETNISGKCYSSCALIFIAGVRRKSLGELGLHRPYFAAAPQSRETLETQAPAAHRDCRP